MKLCKDCNSIDIKTGCPYCLKDKIRGVEEENEKMRAEIKFLQNELELINEQQNN
tara:strand:- start:345 stop:509 length:165 start_codon:yes stop_codon:yes gene_type:complete